MAYQTVSVLSNSEIAPGVFAMAVPWSQPVRPGQFFMLRYRSGAVLLPRAISVCDRPGGDELLFCYQVVGRGTQELASLQEGDPLCMTGPLGNGFPVEALTGRVALVGGGIGAAPLLYTAKELHKTGQPVDCFLGFRDAPFLDRAVRPYVDRLQTATESGREGVKGLVTALLHPGEYSAVLCCGPEPMMKAVTALCMQAGTPVYVSLENKMACGLGACLVCTCTDKAGRSRRTCKEGPVFRGEEINFDA